MVTYVATIGATDGNIMAAIITTQVTMKNTGPPGPIDMSMPWVRTTVNHHASVAPSSSAAYVATRQRTNGSSRHRYPEGTAPVVVRWLIAQADQAKSEEKPDRPAR